MSLYNLPFFMRAGSTGFRLPPAPGAGLAMRLGCARWAADLKSSLVCGGLYGTSLLIIAHKSREVHEARGFF